MKRKGLVIALSVLALLLVPLTAGATNAWSKYHWERTETDAAGEPLPLALTFGDNVWTRWDDHLDAANTDWNASAVLSNTVVGGAATNPTTTCTPATGKVEVCAQNYGENGWLGVAGIWVTRGKDKHITRGYVKLNDFYFDLPQYGTADWRQLVTCQEVGHIFGLAHQDESFDNANVGTCMDYTSAPVKDDIDNTQPNQHDFDQLLTIYDGHHVSDGGGDDGDGGNGGGPPPGRGRGNGNGNGTGADHSEFGRAIHTDPDGRPDVFELDLPNGEKLITHVTWAR